MGSLELEFSRAAGMLYLGESKRQQPGGTFVKDLTFRTYCLILLATLPLDILLLYLSPLRPYLRLLLGFSD